MEYNYLLFPNKPDHQPDAHIHNNAIVIYKIMLLNVLLSHNNKIIYTK